MRLNPNKCFFGVGVGRFLGFMISSIEANLYKCEAILSMRSLTCLKEVQRLNDKLAALSRFLRKLVEKSKPFFKLLKGAKTFLYDDACEQNVHSNKIELCFPYRFDQPTNSRNFVGISSSSTVDHQLGPSVWRWEKQHPVY